MDEKQRVLKFALTTGPGAIRAIVIRYLDKANVVLSPAKIKTIAEILELVESLSLPENEEQRLDDIIAQIEEYEKEEGEEQCDCPVCTGEAGGIAINLSNLMREVERRRQQGEQN